MIPERFVLSWRNNAVWQTPAQVEQDLVISRALVNLYREPHIYDTLVFRAGTALNKLFFEPTSKV